MNWKRLILPALLFFAAAAGSGCTTTLARTAKVRKGVSINFSGMGLHFFDPENKNPAADADDADAWTGSGQFSLRVGVIEPVQEGEVGFSIGARVPLPIFCSQLDLYLQLPKNNIIDLGIGVGLGYLCDIHFCVSRDFGPFTPLASFQYQVFIDSRIFQSFSPSIGFELNMGNHVSLIVSAAYFFTEGDYIILNIFDKDAKIETNSFTVSVGLDFHFGSSVPSM